MNKGANFMLEHLSKYFFYPLWDIKDKSSRLKEWRTLERQQWWSKADLEALQERRLRKIVAHAGAQSDHYRKLFQKVAFDHQNFDWPEFKTLPVTTKADIRNDPETFLANNINQEDLLSAKTGGSTGVSLNLFFDKQCQEQRNAAQLMADRWAGWDLGVKKASIWGNPPTARTIKQKITSKLIGRTIYLDTMHLDEQSMERFVERWRVEKPGVVFGHAHSIYLFARYLLDNQISDLRPRAIIATSMMLLHHERETIEAAFGCEVTNRYGCEEVGLIACECEKHNGMHINSPHIYIEFVDENNELVPEGEPGKIVVTDLNNFVMPLIRYRVEDVGSFSNRECDCGRKFPMLESLEGRVADFLKLPDGAKVAGISLVERTLTKVVGLEQMQLVQDNLHALTVNRVKGSDYDTHTDMALISCLREVFDDRVAITLNDVNRIPQEPSGKYRFSICNV